jgi:hypothetical protein
MIRATGAKLRMLASEAVLLFACVLFGVERGGERDECGEEDDISQAARRPFSRHTADVTGWAQWQVAVIRRRDARVEQLSASRDARWSNPSTCRLERNGAQIKTAGGSKGNRRTIGDWKPSILLLDLEFVTYLSCVLLCVPVHGLFFVRRLDWFHTLLLWGRGRHIIGCLLGSVCAGDYFVGDHVTGRDDGTTWRPSMQPAVSGVTRGLVKDAVSGMQQPAWDAANVRGELRQRRARRKGASSEGLRLVTPGATWEAGVAPTMELAGALCDSGRRDRDRGSRDTRWSWCVTVGGAILCATRAIHRPCLASRSGGTICRWTGLNQGRYSGAVRRGSGQSRLDVATLEQSTTRLPIGARGEDGGRWSLDGR